MRETYSQLFFPLTLKMRIFHVALPMLELAPILPWLCLARLTALAHEPTLSILLSTYPIQNFIFPTSFNGKLEHMLPKWSQIPQGASSSYENHFSSPQLLNQSSQQAQLDTFIFLHFSLPKLHKLTSWFPFHLYSLYTYQSQSRNKNCLLLKRRRPPRRPSSYHKEWSWRRRNWWIIILETSP